MKPFSYQIFDQIFVDLHEVLVRPLHLALLARQDLDLGRRFAQRRAEVVDDATNLVALTDGRRHRRRRRRHRRDS